MAPRIDVYSAVVFDFDGTLADSFLPIAQSVNHVRGIHGLPPLGIDDVRKHVGRGPEHLLRETVLGCEFPRDITLYREHHPTVMFDGTVLLPGARDALERLHGLGKGIGLCSNKPRFFSSKLLDRLSVASFFNVVLGPEDVPRPKPFPDMLQEAVRRLNAAASAVLYVGDMTVDIDTARAAGVDVWTVPTGTESAEVLRAARPDRLLASLSDLFEPTSLGA